MQRIITIVFLMIAALSPFHAQQNEDFKLVKNYYNYQRELLNTGFKKKFDSEKETSKKLEIKKDFQMFMTKMDSIENVALLGALIKTKNLETLKNINQPSSKNDKELTKDSSIASYPGGMNALREKVSELVYSDSVLADYPIIKTLVRFTVEQDGSITHVKATGENPSFNRQAEIALYLLPEKFSPSYSNGMPVKSYYNLPLSINFK